MRVTNILAVLVAALVVPDLAIALVPTPGHGGGFPPPPPPPVIPPRPGPGNVGPRPAGPARSRPKTFSGGAPNLPAPSGPAAGSPVYPAGPLQNPFTLSGQKIEDLTDWRMWWELNRDIYLRLGSRSLRPNTDGGEFFLGSGQRLIVRDRGRASGSDVRQLIIPALTTVIRSGGKYDLLRETIIAHTKAMQQGSYANKLESLRWFLSENDHAVINQTAALAFGIMADEGGVDELVGLLADTTEGRELVGDEVVDPTLRAFAAYGLGLLGQAAKRPQARHNIVAALVRAFEDPETTPELRSAVVLAFGLVPLEPSTGETSTCPCDQCASEGPASSLDAQVMWLVSAFMEERSLSDGVRAQTTTSLARLISDRPSMIDPFLKERVAELLMRALDKEQRQPEVVKESAVLALGMIGDADNDRVDAWIRWGLDRSARSGRLLERRFALIGLGLVGSRPGQGDEPFAGTDEARNTLVHHLTKGRRSVRPWAGLSLGVMGHWLLFNGEPLSPTAALALKAMARTSRRVDNLGAYALAMGLRRDGERQEFLLKALDKTRDDAARGYVALALGLIGDRAAVDPLRDLVSAKRTPPSLRKQCGMALGLLSDFELAPLLLADLAERRDAENYEAIAVALGSLGDDKSIEALTTLFRNAELEDGPRTLAAVALGRLADPLPLTWRSRLATGTNYHGAPESLTNREGTGALNLH